MKEQETALFSISHSFFIRSSFTEDLLVEVHVQLDPFGFRDIKRPPLDVLGFNLWKPFDAAHMQRSFLSEPGDPDPLAAGALASV